MSPEDKELYDEAVATLKDRYVESRHTVSAAAWLKDGSTITAINSQHYSGFLCAEMALLDLSINQKKAALDTIVCVHYKGSTKEHRVVNSCGKCRQILLEYSPDVKLLVSDGESIKKVNIFDLLPYAYIQTSTKRIWDES